MSSYEIFDYVLIAIGLAVLVYAIVLYNNLVSVKHNVLKSWSNIDVLLKQRNNELPKLVDTCKEYMGYEQEALTKIVKARQLSIDAQDSKDMNLLGKSESLMRGALGKLFALAEEYPDLKANQSFMNLQNRISTLENSIADRREIYNETANINNIRIQQFPDVIIALIFRFKKQKLLEFSEHEKKDVDIHSLF